MPVPAPDLRGVTGGKILLSRTFHPASTIKVSLESQQMTTEIPSEALVRAFQNLDSPTTYDQVFGIQQKRGIESAKQHRVTGLQHSLLDDFLSFLKLISARAQWGEVLINIILVAIALILKAKNSVNTEVRTLSFPESDLEEHLVMVFFS